MTKDLVTVSFKLPASDLRRVPQRNKSGFYRKAVRAALESQSGKPRWTPRTPAGKRMLELRARYIARGGELLGADGIADELRERRGGRA